MTASTCGCCAGVHEETPRLTTNRHGLSAIAYRAGDYATFLRSMLGTLSGTPRVREDGTPDYPLSRLTRDRDDFSIALLDAWATTSDVLTFYQERIANEAYLRTAGERLSVVELTRLIGYELAPGVAASVWLAFNVDDAEGAPGEVTIAAGTKVQSVPAQDETPQTFETSAELYARAEWNALKPRSSTVRVPAEGDTKNYFDGTETGLEVGDGLLFFKDADNWDFCRVLTVVPDFDAKRTYVTWSEPLTAAVTVSGSEEVRIYAFRVQSGLFGHNAPDPRTFSSDTVTAFNTNTTDTTSRIETSLEWKFPLSSAGNEVFLEGEHLGIGKNTFVILQAGTTTKLFIATAITHGTRSAFAVSGQATQLLLLPADAAGFAGQYYRATVAFAASERLTLGETPLTGTLTQSIELDRRIKALDVGRAVILSDATGAVAESASLSGIDTDDPSHTKLHLAAPLTNTFDLTTARIFANVTAATHGETVREVLGSGDTPTPFQRFALSHTPLTYVPSASASGAASTLQVFVNDILWSERDSLYGAATNERVYETLRDSEERTYVQFGDGKTTGAPVPSGSDNVRAIYRKDIGVAANVTKHKITLLMSRPLGLEGVDNPLPASGGADAETLAQARENAPGTVRTLDRVVSLADYQDFAASFAGVAKAIATWSFAGTESQVFLTIAGPDGATFDADSATVEALYGALVAAGDSFVPLRIESYQPAKFNITAKVGVDSDRVAGVVLQDVRDALSAAFSFDARSFGEAVDLSDIIAVIHSVAGVRSVDIDLLYRVATPPDVTTPAPNKRLSAAKPRQFANGTLRAAEILILDVATITEAS